MTKKKFEQIWKSLLPDLPGFAVKGPLLFMRPIDHTLRGVCFNGSIDPRGFYPQLFVQPLFVPAEHIGFNFGWRLGDASYVWQVDSPDMIVRLGRALQDVAVPFLSRIESPRDVVDAARGLNKSGDRIVQQAIAYSLAYAGDVREAVDALRDLTRGLDVTNPWQLEMAERATSLESLLLSDVQRAKRQLDAWKAETLRSLKLE